MTTINHNGKLYRVEDVDGKPELVEAKLEGSMTVAEAIKLGIPVGTRVTMTGSIYSTRTDDDQYPLSVVFDGDASADETFVSPTAIITLLEDTHD